MEPFALTLDEITTKLNEMQNDPAMHTVDIYSPAASAWPDSRMPFVEVHLAYLRSHKKVIASQYLSNLRLMIKKG